MTPTPRYVDKAERDKLRETAPGGLMPLEVKLLDALDHLSAQAQEGAAQQAALAERVVNAEHELTCSDPDGGPDVCRHSEPDELAKLDVSDAARELLKKARMSEVAEELVAHYKGERDAYREDAEKWRAFMRVGNVAEWWQEQVSKKADLQRKNAALKEKLETARRALQYVEAWALPSVDGSMESYEFHYGSQGAKHFMQTKARRALAQLGDPE